MKRMAFLTLVLSLLIGLCACGGTGPTVAVPEAPSGAGAASENPGGAAPTSEIGSSSASNLSDGPALILARLEKAYNSQDLDAITDCFDPAISRATFGILGLTGMPIDKVEDVLPFFAFDLALGNSSWGTVTLTAIGQTINGSDAELRYNTSLKSADGSDYSFDETANCILVDGDWYFAIGKKSAYDSPVLANREISDEDVAELYPYKENGLYGILNQSGTIIVEPFFEKHPGDSLEYDYIPVMKKGKWGIIDRKGKLVVDFLFQEIAWERYHETGDGFFEVKYNDKWGLFNPDTGEYIPCAYEQIGEMSGGFAPAKLNGYWGVIDKQGRTTVDFIYDNMRGNGCVLDEGHIFTYGMIAVELNNIWGVINTGGDYIIPLGKSEMTYGGYGQFMATENCIVCGQADPWDGRYKRSYAKQLYFPSTQKSYSIKSGKDGLRFEDLYVCEDGAVILGPNKYDTDGDLIWSVYDIMPETMSFVCWIKGDELFKVKDSNKHYNYMRVDGSLAFLEWANTITQNNAFTAVYSYSSKTTRVYDHNFETIVALSGEYYCYPGNELILTTVEPHNDGWSYTGGMSFTASIYSLRDGSENTYYSAEFSGNLDYAAGQCFVVSDGVFYGLLVGDRLIGNGVAYASVEYSKGADFFIMRLGANSEYYRIGRDGTIVKLD